MTGPLVLLSASPALAHDRLERVEPAAGQQLAQPPEKVRLVFDQAVGRRFSTVVVTGPDGAGWASGPAQVLDGTVTQPLRPGGPGGAYTLAYRIVSADGHPVTGTSTFTVAGGPATSAAAPASSPPVSPPETMTTTAAGLPHTHGHSSSPLKRVSVGVGVVAVLATGLWAADRRRRGAASADQGPGDRR